jgi:repressor LexA
MKKPTSPKTPGAARRRPSKPSRTVARRPVPFAASESTPDREQAVLDFIAASLRDRGYPPTIREIGEAFAIASTNGVRYYLDRLERAGRIRRDRWTSRGIEVNQSRGQSPGQSPSMSLGPSRGSTIEAPPRGPRPVPVPTMPARHVRPAMGAFEIPLLGRVAAGAPILAEEHVEDTIVVDGSLVRPGKHFALRVRGDSMKNAGILDGDIVIVQHEALVRSGEIAVVLIGEEATVKRFFPRRDRILLFPENEDYEPIEVRESDPDVRVAGKVVGVFRRLD